MHRDYVQVDGAALSTPHAMTDLLLLYQHAPTRHLYESAYQKHCLITAVSFLIRCEDLKVLITFSW
jgi:hypothetical protein